MTPLATGSLEFFGDSILAAKTPDGILLSLEDVQFIIEYSKGFKGPFSTHGITSRRFPAFTDCTGTVQAAVTPLMAAMLMARHVTSGDNPQDFHDWLTTDMPAQAEKVLGGKARTGARDRILKMLNERGSISLTAVALRMPHLTALERRAIVDDLKAEGLVDVVTGTSPHGGRPGTVITLLTQPATAN